MSTFKIRDIQPNPFRHIGVPLSYFLPTGERVA